MRPVFLKRTRAEWLKRLADHDVASAEINTIGEAVGDAEVAHLGLFEKRQRPGYGDMTMLRRAPRINGAREPQQKMPPLLGEHTQAVLREFGYDDAALAMLRDGKVI
jgi:crotonobetainyl-CoA:carnitine CoA-transferase CaiB-like acyl-CoA transferase